FGNSQLLGSAAQELVGFEKGAKPSQLANVLFVRSRPSGIYLEQAVIQTTDLLDDESKKVYQALRLAHENSRVSNLALATHYYECPVNSRVYGVTLPGLGKINLEYSSVESRPDELKGVLASSTPGKIQLAPGSSISIRKENQKWFLFEATSWLKWQYNGVLMK